MRCLVTDRALCFSEPNSILQRSPACHRLIQELYGTLLQFRIRPNLPTGQHQLSQSCPAFHDPTRHGLLIE